MALNLRSLGLSQKTDLDPAPLKRDGEKEDIWRTEKDINLKLISLESSQKTDIDPAHPFVNRAPLDEISRK